MNDTGAATSSVRQAEALLEVRELRTYFHRRGLFGALKPDDYVAAVDGVSLTVREGQTLGIVGESGCGKTTLGRTLLRLVPATSGSVRYRGEELLDLSPAAMRARRREIQMIFQDLDAALNPAMSVRDLLAEAVSLRGRLRRTETIARCEELLDLVKLDRSKLSAAPQDLSGGEKRRVSIARVLAVEPRLIVADEPLSALDVSIAAQVANLMRDLQERLGLSYLFISHDLRMVELIAHDVIVMYLGKVVEAAPTRELAARRAHPYARLLWSASDPLGGRRAGPGVIWDALEDERPRSGCRFRARCPVYAERGEPAKCRDADAEPILAEISPGHRVACHYPQE